MRKFMDQDFLLSSETAKHLYHDYASKMPIIDYHCHLSPQEIYEDRTFETITQVWLGGDHYKWRIMRAHGVEEKYITGDGDDRTKFRKWAETVSMAIGNPLHHWSHLELRNYFDYQGVLNEDTADEVYDLCNEKLKTMSARKMIEMSHVTHLCTTDDPVDDLHWHRLIKADESFNVTVLPAWRPDKAMNIAADTYQDYIAKLSEVSGVEIHSYKDLMEALKLRLEFFAENGCTVSDHGMENVAYVPASEEEIVAIFAKRMAGEKVSALEERKFRTAFLTDLGREYAKRNWVMQLHYGVIRDNNKKVFRALGPDAGIDSIGSSAPMSELAYFLNGLAETDELPKTIVYSLNPIDNTAIETIIACFQEGPAVSKMQHGAAWWFNDHKLGMIEQMTSLANEGMLADFVGMLTDSRSFLSYARHEYFRRILCDLVGTWVENGEYPDDEKALRKIIEGISYNNAKRYFEFN
ncbi:MAG: glucuronate isomerase [Solobacterium sp.]|nr:glucuronate isomerase [Solobacterium sp.]